MMCARARPKRRYEHVLTPEQVSVINRRNSSMARSKHQFTFDERSRGGTRAREVEAERGRTPRRSKWDV